MFREELIKSANKIKKYCKDNNIHYYPEFIDVLPEYGRKVNKFIKTRGKRDLPHSHFNDNNKGKIDPVKMIGLLGQSKTNGIFDIKYQHPFLSSAIIQKGVIFTASSERLHINSPDRLRLADVAIQYRSRHKGIGEISKNDAESLAATCFLIQFESSIRPTDIKDIFFNIYLPHMDEVVWYQIKKFDRYEE